MIYFCVYVYSNLFKIDSLINLADYSSSLRNIYKRTFELDPNFRGYDGSELFKSYAKDVVSLKDIGVRKPGVHFSLRKNRIKSKFSHERCKTFCKILYFSFQFYAFFRKLGFAYVI